MQHVWGEIAPPAMYTAAGNLAVRSSEDFSTVLNNINWNKTVTEAAHNNFNGGLSGAINGGTNGSIDGAFDGIIAGGLLGPNGTIIGGLGGAIAGGIGGAVDGYNNPGYGFSGTSAIKPAKQEGSNGGPTQFDPEFNYFVEKFGKGDDVYVPAGFGTIKGENIVYADTLPPFDISLTFGNEYGQAAFQKIYDVDILNESSGVSVDSIIMERAMTYICRRISPLIRGVYSREEGGIMKGISPTA